MALTPEQIKYLDEQTGFKNPDDEQDAVIAQQRAEKILQRGKIAKEKKLDGPIGTKVLRGVVGDPLNALVVRPAIRTGQAVGALGLKFADKLTKGKVAEFIKKQSGKTLDDAIADASAKDTKSPFAFYEEKMGIPIGKDVKGIKSGTAGVKQIAGEGLEAAVDIASVAGVGIGGKFAKGVDSVLGRAARGALAGGATGAVYGGGLETAKGLQEDLPGGEIVSKGIYGGLVGGATGAVLGAGTGALSAYIGKRAARQKEIAEGLRGTIVPKEKIVNAEQAIKTSKTGFDFNTPEGEFAALGVKKSDIFNPDGSFNTATPQGKQALAGRIDDVAYKLRDVDERLAEEFRSRIDPAHATYEDIVNTGLETVDDFKKASSAASGYMMTPDGNIKIDPKTREAMRQGIVPEDTAFINNSSPEDQNVYRQMYKIHTRALADKAVPDRAFEKSGETVVTAAKNIKKVRSDIGKELGQVAKSMPQTPMDISKTTSEFLQDLDNAGISVVDDIKGTSVDDTLDFTGSRYENQPTVQKQIERAFKALFKNDGAALTPADIISTRQRMFTDLKMAQANNEIIPGDYADVILNKVYDNLDEPIKAANPKYGELTQKYAQASNALRDFGSLMGKGVDLADDSADLTAGEVGRRILGNASAKTIRVLKNLEDAASALGVPLKGNIRNQTLFADFLERELGNTQTTSLQGESSKAIKSALDIGQGFRQGLWSGVTNLAEKGVEAAKNINPEAKRKAIEALIGLASK